MADETQTTQETTAQETTTTETILGDQSKTTETAATATEDKDGKADKPSVGAPEKYEAFKVPDGQELDAAKLEAFTPLAKELNLNQENAQKLVDFYAKTVSEAHEATQKAFVEMTEGWKTASEKDKEFGGANFDANIGIAKKALDEFGTPEFKEALNQTRMGNHPELVRFLWKVGKLLAEDKIRSGKTEAAAPKPITEVLYPTMTK